MIREIDVLDHGHRAALPLLPIALVDRQFILSGAHDTTELTENALPTVRNISGEINLRFCCACAATLCCSAKNISKFTNVTY